MDDIKFVIDTDADWHVVRGGGDLQWRAKKRSAR